MFDNLGTAVVQAVGFFGVFGFFVYQLLSDGKKPLKSQFKTSNKKVNEPKDKVEKSKKKGLFAKKIEPIKEEVKPKKKGLFARKIEPIKEEVKPKKKGWFKQLTPKIKKAFGYLLYKNDFLGLYNKIKFLFS